VRSRPLVVALLGLCWGAWAVAQNQPSTSDQIDALRQGLSPDQQSSILQSVLGRTGDNSGTKSDAKLSMPATIQQSGSDATGSFNQYGRLKTVDGRTIRQPGEDTELRADDTVLIELTPIDDVSSSSSANPQVGGQQIGGQQGGGQQGGDQQVGGVNSINTMGNNPNAQEFSKRQREGKPRTNEEKERMEKFRKRVLSNNPYRLNRFGVLEIPGLLAIPLAGLTASEATRRLNADPDLADYTVRLTLLRLQPYGEDSLKPFGYDLFQGVPSTFAPVQDIQVPLSYVVGPGDRLDVQLYGNETAIYKLTVERDGRINFPKLGPINIGGLTFDEARSAIEGRVSQQMIGTRASVVMGDLRSIRVFVLGEAEKPGSYTVSGLSTMTNALFVSGGVKKIGSLRNIQLKRDGRLVTVLDLYDLLLHGDTSGDRELLPGDVIFIPPIGETVSVSGSVRRPAIYELKGEKAVEQVIDIAGGLLPDADLKRVQMERILPSKVREMRNIDLTAIAGRSTGLTNGDKLRIPEILPTVENSVTLSGYVFRPGSFEYRPGLRLSDVLGSFEELRPNADGHYIMIRRVVPPEEKVEVVSADLSAALARRGSAADVELHPRDEITVFNLSASRERILQPILKDLELQATPDKPEQIVSVDGRVKAPGRYPLETNMHVSDLIRAGGSLEDAAYRGEADLARYEVLDGTVRQTQLISVNLAAIRRGDSGADLVLKPYDVLIVKPIAQWQEPGTVELAGEVRFPGKYPIRQGETLYSVLNRAGGLTDGAFAKGAVFIREELKKREKEQLELLANRLQGDLASLSLEAVASSAAGSGSSGSASATQGLVVGEQLMAQLRETQPVGRLVIDVGRVMKGPAGAPGDVSLRDGDRLLVPKISQEVTILGEVQSPTSHVFEPGLSRDDYIARSGGVTQKADRKRIYVVQANGNVVTGGRTGWFRRSQQVEIQPGDTIVVPLDTERVRALPLWQAVTSIIYNLAVALLAIRSV
jgi:protein involved in polysaccharide export with SLBB domain